MGMLEDEDTIMKPSPETPMESEKTHTQTRKSERLREKTVSMSDE